MKANKGKCHLLISISENITINVDDNITEKNICEKILGLKIKKKTGRKVNALSRILRYMNFEK